MMPHHLGVNSSKKEGQVLPCFIYIPKNVSKEFIIPVIFWFSLDYILK